MPTSLLLLYLSFLLTRGSFFVWLFLTAVLAVHLHSDSELSRARQCFQCPVGAELTLSCTVLFPCVFADEAWWHRVCRGLIYGSHICQGLVPLTNTKDFASSHHSFASGLLAIPFFLLCCFATPGGAGEGWAFQIVDLRRLVDMNDVHAFNCRQ